jgi:carbon monoxide dehydrogenase subunit G
MTEVSKTAQIAADPAKVWTLLGRFDGLDAWMPSIASCEGMGSGPGATRTLTLGDGGTVIEELVSVDESARRYTYKILEAPLPIKNYLSAISVTAEGSGSGVSWACEFDADGAPEADMEAMLVDLYQSSLDNAKKLLEG